jgi:hypothetical protein
MPALSACFEGDASCVRWLTARCCFSLATLFHQGLHRLYSSSACSNASKEKRALLDFFAGYLSGTDEENSRSKRGAAGMGGGGARSYHRLPSQSHAVLVQWASSLPKLLWSLKV